MLREYLNSITSLTIAWYVYQPARAQLNAVRTLNLLLHRLHTPRCRSIAPALKLTTVMAMFSLRLNIKSTPRKLPDMIKNTVFYLDLFYRAGEGYTKILNQVDVVKIIYTVRSLAIYTAVRSSSCVVGS